MQVCNSRYSQNRINVLWPDNYATVLLVLSPSPRVGKLHCHCVLQAHWYKLLEALHGQQQLPLEQVRWWQGSLREDYGQSGVAWAECGRKVMGLATHAKIVSPFSQLDMTPEGISNSEH